MTKNDIIYRVEKEFITARTALAAGNEGKVRVCARRAAGHALSWFLTKYPRTGWGNDMLSQLHAAKNEPTFPKEIRNAAERLTAKISDRFDYPVSVDPIDDAQSIVNYIRSLMEE